MILVPPVVKSYYDIDSLCFPLICWLYYKSASRCYRSGETGSMLMHAPQQTAANIIHPFGASCE